VGRADNVSLCNAKKQSINQSMQKNNQSVNQSINAKEQSINQSIEEPSELTVGGNKISADSPPPLAVPIFGILEHTEPVLKCYYSSHNRFSSPGSREKSATSWTSSPF
jgi:hypothetical protein